MGGSGWTIEDEDMAALERFFETEDEWLQQEQIRALQSILTGELEADGAFADLVYVLETLVDMDLALEEEIMPIYEEMMPLRKRPVSDRLEELQCLQTELRERYLSLLSAEPCAESRIR